MFWVGRGSAATTSTSGPLRIGYTHDPPYMFRAADGRPSGLDVDVVAEAARRAAVDVRWVYVTGRGGADAALAAGQVDVWPALTILESRRRVLHFTDPWLRTEILLMVRDDGPRPSGSYSGRVGAVALPVTELMVTNNFPRATLVPYRDGPMLARGLCAGEVPMGLVSAADLAKAMASPGEACRQARLRSYPLQGSTLNIAIAARSGHETAADLLRQRIDDMAADGSIRTLVQPYSFHAASEVLGVYELLQERARTRLFTWGTMVLGAALVGSSALFGALLRANRRARRSLVEKAALEERLRAAQRLELVGQFTGGVAHDFNNLVTIIVGYASVAADRAHADPLVNDALQQIRKAGERASDLVRHLLALGRKEVTEPRELAVHAQVENLQPMLRQLLGEPVRITLDLQAGDARIFMDPGQFSRVLLNLAANARDAMPEGGSIRIATFRESAADAASVVCLAFEDCGAGMPQDVCARVFEPFFTTKGPARGTGLGLSVVRDIVAESGGTIGVSSEIGRGTRFEIRWPLVTGADLSPSRDDAAGTAAATHTVLVVEDREELRTLMTRVLAGAGYHVLSAADGGEALTLLQARGEQVSLVVSDVLMPRVSGPSLLAQARQLGLAVPFLFTSGHADDVDAAGDLSGTRMLPKPFTPTQLLEAVGALTGRPPTTPPRA
ncbi:hypothetical protein TBR22_A46090 [Luteitalea sp. TBR-22]|nr:hypothetical protein TBR22_A46090 [Luteitalea sp. TBR-22]